MKRIVITTETFFENEADAIHLLFENGLETLHLRKPLATRLETEVFIRQIRETFHSHIVIHDHYDLMSSYDLKGIHLNKARKKELAKAWKGTVSYSCHTFEEVMEMRFCDYVFLSPIFDSLSKVGYKQGFTLEQLKEAKERQIINERVIALGGITADVIPMVRALGFGGIAVIGYLWGRFPVDRNVSELLKRFEKLNMA